MITSEVPFFDLFCDLAPSAETRRYLSGALVTAATLDRGERSLALQMKCRTLPSAICGEVESLLANSFALRRATVRVQDSCRSETGKEKRTKMRVIMGHEVKSAVTPMRELPAVAKNVTVEGTVFKLDCRETRRLGMWMLKIEITDYTGSVALRKNMSRRDAEALRERISAGMWLRASGSVELSYDGKDAYLNPRSICEVEHNGRMDRAPEKRVELHLHTKMSAMDALTDPERVVALAAKWGMNAIAVTDHGVAQAFPDMWRAGEKHGVKILYGCEGYYVNDMDAPDTENKKQRTNHIVILAKSRPGLKHLYQLISASNLKYFKCKPIIPKSELIGHCEGLIIGSACEAGELFRAVVDHKDWDELKRIASFYDYLEIQPICNNRFMVREGKAKDDEELKDYNRMIVRLGEELGKPVVATGDVHFQEPEDEEYRHILLASQKFSDATAPLPLYFRTTDEMLKEFEYLGKEKAYEVVVTNTRMIADLVENIELLPKGKLFPPRLENSEEDLNRMVWEKAHALYGDELPQLVTDRLNVELGSILGKYDVVYMSAQKLVQRSLENGYLVGSRGSVGSSLVAYMAGITEVNSLPPHYRCPKCKNVEFVTDGSYGCGADMPDKVCPKCGEKYVKDGFDIPFETFLGYGGGKVPDIDLNFSGEYQSRAHRHAIEMFGETQVFRAGTIGTLADKTAYGMVLKYLEENNREVTSAEKDRLTAGCVGVRRTTGQHPGGLVVVPDDLDVEDFCPVQHSADDPDSDIITTHFEYHCMEDNLLKLDMLGHDDPTMIRMLENLTGVNARQIPLDDPDTLSLFTTSKALGFENDDLLGPTGAVAIPEFNTRFTRQMLVDTQPKDFNTLLRLSGFSHGTDVWLGNAKDLITSGTASVLETVGCRDDIMLYLISKGLEPKMSFKIMESVRKGKVKKNGFEDGWVDAMHDHEVPEWYIDSLAKIGYLFPKAHAVAYVMMAFRIAWFKVHEPLAFYATFFSVRAKAFDAQECCFPNAAEGAEKTKRRIREIEEKKNKKETTAVEEDLMTTLEVCYEFYLRGFHFDNIDIFKSDATKFLITENGLLPPFTSVRGLGEAAAQDTVEKREGKEFVSVEEFAMTCNKLSKTHIEQLRALGAFGNLAQSSQVTLF